MDWLVGPEASIFGLLEHDHCIFVMCCVDSCFCAHNCTENLPCILYCSKGPDDPAL